MMSFEGGPLFDYKEMIFFLIWKAVPYTRGSVSNFSVEGCPTNLRRIWHNGERTSLTFAGLEVAKSALMGASRIERTIETDVDGENLAIQVLLSAKEWNPNSKWPQPLQLFSWREMVRAAEHPRVPPI